MKKTATLRHAVKAWLEAEGHRATIDGGDERLALVCFRSRGQHFCVRVDETDRRFLCLNTTYTLPPGVDELTLRRAAAIAESTTKAFKIEFPPQRDTMVAAVESFCEVPGKRRVIWRALDVIEHGAQRFFAALEDCSTQVAAARFTEELERDLGTAPGHE